MKFVARRKQARKWANNRRGFKQELTESLVDQGFEYPEAEDVIEAILASIKQALLRKETVTVRDFGEWVVIPPKAKRAYRLGKIVHLHHRIQFNIDHQVFEDASKSRKPFHLGWENSPTRKPQLRGKKLQDHLRREEATRRHNLLTKYFLAILRFFHFGLPARDWQTIWTIRWRSPYYVSEYSRCRATDYQRRAIADAEILMQETRPPDTPLNPGMPDRAWLNNHSIDCVQWYARWSAFLEVEPDLWSEAEKMAQEHLLSPSSSGYGYLLNGGTLRD